MSTQSCECAILKDKVESLTSANTTYRTNIRKLLIENGTLRLLIEQLTFCGRSDAAREENNRMVSAEDNGNPTFASYYNQTTDRRAVGMLNTIEYEDRNEDSVQMGDDETEDAVICHNPAEEEEFSSYLQMVHQQNDKGISVQQWPQRSERKEADYVSFSDTNGTVEADLEMVSQMDEKLHAENGNNRPFISGIGPPWKNEPSGDSKTNFVGQKYHGVINFDGPEDEDGYELEMVDGVFHMADGDNLASQAHANSSLSVLDRSDDEDQYQAQDHSLWAMICTWKCALCGKKIRGGRRHRLKHIVTHKKFKFSCPFDGCSALLNFWSFKVSHVPRRHHVEYKNLPATMKQHVEDERVKLIAKAKEFEREVYPDTNRFNNDKCKVCAAKVISQWSQRFHIASHLNLELSCPFDGCNNRCELAKIYEHLRFAHPPMSQEIKKKLEEDVNVCLHVAAEAKDAYFVD